ncbi:MAG: plasmid recombination protein [Parasporobacterium sp.]|nr:plasmid recombination protein [Parasporobacterium sp.]
MNCSRKGNANHTERRFDIDKAEHIDKTRTQNNIYMFFGGEEKPLPKFLYSKDGFKAKELEYYEKTFKESMERKNQYYQKKGKYKYIKRIEDLYNGEKTKPEELILQFGNKDDHPGPDILIKAFDKYMAAFNKWNKQHGNHVRILDAALHLDEQTPHWHIRRVYEYDDKYGNKDLGVKRALEQAGLQRPDPEKEEGRFNNVKMSFDQKMRDLWIAIGRQLGLTLDNAPKIGSRGSLDIKKYKEKQLDEEIERSKEYRDSLNEEIEEKEGYADQLTDIIRDIEDGAVATAYDLIDNLSFKEKEERER